MSSMIGKRRFEPMSDMKTDTPSATTTSCPPRRISFLESPRAMQKRQCRDGDVVRNPMQPIHLERFQPSQSTAQFTDEVVMPVLIEKVNRRKRKMADLKNSHPRASPLSSPSSSSASSGGLSSSASVTSLSTNQSNQHKHNLQHAQQHEDGSFYQPRKRFKENAHPSQRKSATSFSLEQVRQIVNDALEERDRRLRVEYSGVLNQLLVEQFQTFNQFNRDYISRQYKDEDFSYVS